MSARDRLMLMAIVVVAVLGGAWMLVVSPAKEKASKAQGEVTTAQSQLSQALAEAAEARNAQERYRKAYASMTSIGKAVPTAAEVPSLVYALDQAANQHKVEFDSIATGSNAGGAGGGGSSPSSAGAAAASAAPFTQMPFTFTFNGSYSDLIHLLTQLEGFTVQSATGGKLHVSGRLLTIQSITLGSPGQSGPPAASAQSSNQMTWTIGASAYVLAPTSAPAPGATPGASAPNGSSAAAPNASAASPAGATPAVVRANG